MDKFDSDYHANLNKATKLKNDFSMRKTHTAFHQHGTDKDLEQVEFKNHKKVYNWRECDCGLKNLLPDTLVSEEGGDENFIMG